MCKSPLCGNAQNMRAGKRRMSKWIKVGWFCLLLHSVSLFIAAAASQFKEWTASLQTALLRRISMRGPRYKPNERTPIENRRSAATVINRMRWNARQQNSRVLLSFGLTSSCYRVEQQFMDCLGYWFPIGESWFIGWRCPADSS